MPKTIFDLQQNQYLDRIVLDTDAKCVLLLVKLQQEIMPIVSSLQAFLTSDETGLSAFNVPYDVKLSYDISKKEIALTGNLEKALSIIYSVPEHLISLEKCVELIQFLLTDTSVGEEKKLQPEEEKKGRQEITDSKEHHVDKLPESTQPSGSSASSSFSSSLSSSASSSSSGSFSSPTSSSSSLNANDSAVFLEAQIKSKFPAIWSFAVAVVRTADAIRCEAGAKEKIVDVNWRDVEKVCEAAGYNMSSDGWRAPKVFASFCEESLLNKIMRFYRDLCQGNLEALRVIYYLDDKMAKQVLLGASQRQDQSYVQVQKKMAASLLRLLLISDSQLAALNLSGYHMSEELAQVLAQALLSPSCKLTSLDLGCNSMGAKGAQYLAQALQSPNCLTSLSLADNGIGDEGVQALAEAFQSANCRLTSLHLWLNGITAKGAQALAQALQSPNCKLTFLHLWVNSMGSKGAQYLAQALQSPNCLTSLGLANNGIDCEGAQAFAEALQSPQCMLTLLSLEVNDIKVEGAQALARAVAICKIMGRDVKVSCSAENFDDLVKDIFDTYSSLVTFWVNAPFEICQIIAGYLPPSAVEVSFLVTSWMNAPFEIGQIIEGYLPPGAIEARQAFQLDKPQNSSPASLGSSSLSSSLAGQGSSFFAHSAQSSSSSSSSRSSSCSPACLLF